MKKRILTVLLAVCMVFALGTVTALAADEGFPDAGENGVITLTKDITVSGNETLNLTQNSLKTNGYSITVTGTLTVTGTGSVTNDVAPTEDDVKGIFIVNGGTLNIQSGTFETAGAEVIRVNKGTANVSGGTFKCTATDVSSFNERVMFMVSGSESMLNFTAGTIDADSLESNKQHGLYGVYPANGATVVLGTLGGGNQPTIKTDFSAIALNNTTSEPASKVTVNSGYYESGLDRGNTLKENCVIYLPGQCEFVINGGTFVTADTDASVISIPYPGFGVDLDINNGTFNASTGNAIVKTWGVKLSTANNATPNNVSISGGKFTSGSTFADFNENEKLDDFITGGTFKTKAGDADTSVKDYIPDDVSMKFDEETGNVVVDDTTTVATVDGVGYPSLQAAIAAAEEGDTVNITADEITVDLSELANSQGYYNIEKNITINGNGCVFKATSTVTGEDGQGHIFVVKSKATLKNFEIDGSEQLVRYGIQAYGSGADVTIDNVYAHDCYAYGFLANNGAELTIEYGKTADNGWGGVNADTNGGASKLVIEDGDFEENCSVVVENGKDDVYSTDVELKGGYYKNIQVKTAKTDVEISGGSYTAIIGSDDPDYEPDGDDVAVTGGKFKTSVDEFVDGSEYPYEAVSAAGIYSYHTTLNAALTAAGQNGEVNYLRTGTTWDVTLYYDKDVQTKIEVPDDYVFTLPGGTFEGKKIEGWKYGSEVFEPGDRDTITSDRTYYVILRNGEFDIVIDSKIEHGDISTNVNSADKGDTVYIYVDPDTGYVLDDIDVYYGYNYRNSVKVSYVRNNTYRFEMPNADVYITATFKANGMPFVDVHRTQWFYDSIYYVWSNDMMEGDSATTFNPDGTMTRAMFWAVLGRMDGQTITGTNWVEQARNWAMREGVSDGTNPNDYVTREQMVTMLWRYAGEKNGSANLNRYTDSGSVSGYAVEAMRWAIGNGVIQGVTSTTLAPKANATRAECATIFMRFDKM